MESAIGFGARFDMGMRNLLPRRLFRRKGSQLASNMLRDTRPCGKQMPRMAPLFLQRGDPMERLWRFQLLAATLYVGLGAVVVLVPAWVVAQTSGQPGNSPTPSRESLSAQIAALRAQVSRVEANLPRATPAPMGVASPPVIASPGTVGMPMGGMDMMMQGMPAPVQAAPGGNAMPMMGNAPSGTGTAIPSALPGFPGASHLYHIGVTNFFLDHGQHITLSQDQKMSLNQIKQRTFLESAAKGRAIEEAEQSLWQLTASDKPDAVAIEAKVREIEHLRGDQRLAFIRAVGEAAKILTEEQRKTLLGLSPPLQAAAPSDPHAGHQHPPK
ncbi:periplasmic heavy metal sensor [bacterium]|nr:periplasmic heavy metal sensor [bacterium]